MKEKKPLTKEEEYLRHSIDKEKIHRMKIAIIDLLKEESASIPEAIIVNHMVQEIYVKAVDFVERTSDLSIQERRAKMVEEFGEDNIDL